MEQIVNQGKILEIRNGSHLYGLNTPKSDEDFSGVFLAPLEYHIGLHKVEQVDLSIKNKLANGKNSPEAVDKTFYELKRFVNLAIDSNPNILEQLFVDEKNIVFINEVLSYKSGYMSKSIEIDGSFIDRAVINKFCKKIMITLSNKKDYQTQNYTELIVLRHAALTSDAIDGVLNELLALSESEFLKEFPL